MSGEINSETVLDILTARYQTNPELPLTLLIDSEGGQASSVLGLVHELDPFVYLETRALGFCASAAVDLMLAGARRTAYPATRFITHPAFYPIDGIASTDAAGVAARIEADNFLWSSLFATRTKKKKLSFWRDFFSKERAFDAPEALRLGIIDTILT